MKFFDKSNLVKEGEYVYYKDADGRRKFVARFKYNRSRANKFMTFLRNNITVDKYFKEYGEGMTPLAIARDRGFV